MRAYVRTAIECPVRTYTNLRTHISFSKRCDGKRVNGRTDDEQQQHSGKVRVDHGERPSFGRGLLFEMSDGVSLGRAVIEGMPSHWYPSRLTGGRRPDPSYIAHLISQLCQVLPNRLPY